MPEQRALLVAAPGGWIVAALAAVVFMAADRHHEANDAVTRQFAENQASELERREVHETVTAMQRDAEAMVARIDRAIAELPTADNAAKVTEANAKLERLRTELRRHQTRRQPIHHRIHIDRRCLETVLC